MKFLIWLVFCIALSFVQTLIKDFGIMLGALPTYVLYALFYIPADRLCNAWDIKRYKKRYPNNVVENMNDIIDSYKNDFLTKKNFRIQDEGIDFFDFIKNQIASLNNKKIKKLMIDIVKSGSSPEDCILGILDNEAINKVRNGNLDEIRKQKGSTYTISKIYEYANDVQLEKGMLSPIQHKNKVAYIEQICNDNT